MMKNFQKTIFWVSIFLVTSVSLIAQDKKLEIKDAKKSDQPYILPSPAQLFNALSQGKKLGWKDQVAKNSEWNYSSGVKLALNLGARSADAVVFIFDEDYESAINLLTVIDKMAKGLQIDSVKKEDVKAVLASKDKKRITKLIDGTHMP